MPGLTPTSASSPQDFTLPSEFLGLGRLSAKADQAGSHDLIADLLRQNHDNFHMYFRDVAGRMLPIPLLHATLADTYFQTTTSPTPS